MKYIFKKILFCGVLCICFLLTGNVIVKGASEEGKNTKVYFYNAAGWDKVVTWIWTMENSDQLVVSGWPGDEMSEVSDGWYVYEFDCDEDFGVLFNNGESLNIQQTGDSTDLKAGGTYWILTTSGEAVNENGIGGGESVETYTEPFAGWPEAGENASAYQSQEATNGADDKEATIETMEQQGSTLKEAEVKETLSNGVTKDNTSLKFTIICAAAVLVIVIAAFAVIVKKKKRT